MYDIHTRTHIFGQICTTPPQYQGYEYSIFILPPPKFVRMRVRVRISVHVAGGVLARGLTCVGRLSEQPHWRWPKQGAAVAKQGGLGELSGLCKVYRPKMRPAEGAVLFRPIMWLYSASVILGSTLHLALAIFQQGISCFGHRTKKNGQCLTKNGCIWSIPLQYRFSLESSKNTTHKPRDRPNGHRTCSRVYAKQ